MTLHLIPPPLPPVDEFDVFWRAYPRRQDKGDARRAYWETRHIRPDITTLLQAINTQKRTDQWARGFVPNPARWLRGEQWDNEIEIETLDPRQLEIDRQSLIRQQREARQAAWDNLDPEQRLAEINRRRAAMPGQQ